jgi:tetratricopeptide (TPR) repeat protein
VPEDLARTAAPAVGPHTRGWRALQAGDTREAERTFTAVTRQRTTFYPSIAGLGYVELARGDDQQALERFERVEALAPDYVPGLLGKGEALLRLQRIGVALATLETVHRIDPSLADVGRRIETLRFRAIDEDLASAQKAVAEERLDDARALYERAVAASPESAFLYRELARVNRRLGRSDAALDQARRAVALDPRDAGAHLLVGDLLEDAQQWDAALAAVEQARSLAPSPDLDERIDRLRDRAALTRLPEEYRAIETSDRLTRGQLAALIGVRFESLLSTARVRRSVLVTDVRGHWAQPWILSVASAGVMDAFENHTFQPQTLVRRGDLARAISGVLTLIAQGDPALAKRWTGARRAFKDLGPGNLYYPAASLAVVAGILDTGEGEVFQAGRVVSGTEASAALDRLETLAARKGGRPRG